jgi:hypothetical protein
MVLNYYLIEFGIIVIVIVFQLIHTFRVSLSIKSLKELFNNPITVKNGIINKQFLVEPEKILDNIVFTEFEGLFDFEDNNLVRISVMETKGKNVIIIRIKKAINNYLLNNYGAPVNFSLIKDIVDREVDGKDEEISHSIPTPLYLGLAATMVGIILGLFSMPSMSDAQTGISEISSNSPNFSEGITALINGVKLAMFASLSGLFCTTLLSSVFYKRAKSKVLKEKNQQLSYLQASLLPELIKAEDTGVSGLKSSLDYFAREASKIVDTVNRAVAETSLNILAQQETLSRLDSINITKISKVNLELFDKLDRNMSAFNRFSEFLSQMAAISDNLKSFGERTSIVDKLVSEVGSTLKESHELTLFLSTHLIKLESIGNAATAAVNYSDSKFKEAIELLQRKTEESIEYFSKFTNQKECVLMESLETLNSELSKVTNMHIQQFSTAYSNAVPQFQQLEKLNELVLLKEKISSIDSKISGNNQNGNNEILQQLKQISHNTSHQAQRTSSYQLNSSSLVDSVDTAKNNNKLGRWEKFVLGLKIAGWICVISICVGLVLIHFKII